jgi:hypothetical protein
MRINYRKTVEGYAFYHCGNRDMSRSIKLKLEERFSRIVYVDNWERIAVIFRDEADEAAFLLWANEGIEI